VFSFLKKKQASDPSESRWSALTGHRDGKPLIVRRNDSAGQLAGQGGYKYRVGIAIPLREPNDHGLPSNSENEQLRKIEDALVAQLESGEQAVLVLAITTGGMRELVFYARDPVSAKTVIQHLEPKITSHEIQSYVAEDPAWEVYKKFSYREFPPKQ
jgi:uncharacterized protein DUF695